MDVAARISIINLRLKSPPALPAMYDSHDIANLLAEAQRLLDAGDYGRACDEADRIAVALEHAQRTESIEYSEAMRIFGLASYRSGDLVMADGALTSACRTRLGAGRDDDTVKELLLALSEVAMLRDNPVRAGEMLELLRKRSE